MYWFVDFGCKIIAKSWINKTFCLKNHENAYVLSLN